MPQSERYDALVLVVQIRRLSPPQCQGYRGIRSGYEGLKC